MKKIFLGLILIASATNGFAQTKADYDATVQKFREYYNILQTDSIYNMLSDRGKSMMTPEKTRETFKQMFGSLGKMESCEFTKAKDNIWLYKTVFTNLTMSLAVSLDSAHKLEVARFVSYKPDTEAAPSEEKSNIVLKTATGDIYGSLLVPEGIKKMPVVMIIAGSGPTDRNGTVGSNMRTNTYLMIADSLEKAGIASLRYDKRGVAASRAAVRSEESLVFDDYINDAVGFIKMLKEDKRFSKIIILGHSEGSLTGMVAANREPVDGYISVSGCAENIGKILVKQYGAESEEMAKEAKIIIDSLTKGYDVKDVPPTMYATFHHSVQPFMRSWFKYEPAQEIKKLKIPVLIVQGTHDIQVGTEQAEMLKKAYPHATLKMEKGVSHVLKQGPEERTANFATYSNTKLPLDAGLAHDIIKFVKEVK